MNDFQKFVMHVRNLQANGTPKATFDVNYLCKVLENVSPLPNAAPKKANDVIVADGGGFSDE